MKILLIAIFGAAGTLSRYFLGGYVQQRVFMHEGRFPFGTFVVNMAGCFLFGLVWPLAEERLHITTETRSVVLIGFMGAFTTFSTFIFETRDLVAQGSLAFAFINLALQNILGIALLMAGIAIGRLI